MPLHIYPTGVAAVGITSTEDDTHYKISDISLIKPSKKVIITYDE